MPTTELTSETLHAAASVVPDDVPVIMVNLLRYHEHAHYPEGADVAPCSGLQAYFERYVPAFNAMAPEFGGVKPVYLGNALRQLVGPADEEWDNVALIRYPSYSAMVTFLDSRRYLEEAEPHRIAALADWRFIVTSELSL